MSWSRSAARLALIVFGASCHRPSCSKPEEKEPPPDVVTRIPETGPLVLVPNAQIGEDATKLIAPWLIDPESGAMHQLAEVDATCGDVADYASREDGARWLYALRGFVGWSGKRQSFFAKPSGQDVPFVLLSLDGKCAPAWHEKYEWTPAAVSADGATVARKRSSGIELSAVDGTSPRALAWTSGLSINGVALSPSGDRLAFVKENGSPAYDVVTCDLAGGCTTAFSSTGQCTDLQWSPDGARVGCVSTHPDDTDAIMIAEIAHPGRPFVLAHVVKRTPNEHPGRITHFGFSPDGLRVAFVSSHEAGCTPYVRDLGSTCPEALYVASAEHEGPLRRVRGGLQMSERPWWIR